MKDIQVFTYVDLYKIFENHIGEKGIVTHCCNHMQKNQCDKSNLCPHYFSSDENFRNEELAHLEKMTKIQIISMSGEQRSTLIDKYKKKAYKKCRRVSLLAIDSK